MNKKFQTGQNLGYDNIQVNSCKGYLSDEFVGRDNLISCQDAPVDRIRIMIYPSSCWVAPTNHTMIL